MIVNRISILVGGEAGAGITRSGFLLAKSCLRGGLYVFGTNDYQSLIRGGHNSYSLRISDDEVFSHTATLDLLLALNKEAILLHKNELVSGAGILYDGENIILKENEFDRDDVKTYSIPLKKIVTDLGGKMITQNTVALGATIGLLNYNLDNLNTVLKDTFKPEVAELNIAAAKVGYDYCRDHFAGDFDYKLEKVDRSGRKRIFLTGSEAIGLGTLQAGCKFFAAYPMTPATPILHFLSPLDRRFKMIVMQTESEIAAINMIVGAAFAGARAMTATSGGGFCLMSEGLGMAGMTETPIVIVLAQRPGPSTGLPTYSGQGDLRFAIHASQGEFPRLVIAPGDIEECFYKTIEAFNLAEKFQIPAILITDKYLAESHANAEIFSHVEGMAVNRGELMVDEFTHNGEYMRHQLTDNGISPRATPGIRGVIVRTNADEHDERGFTTEDPNLTSQMTHKRFKKLASLREELEKIETVKLYGPEGSDVTILGWGSTKGPIREAIKLVSDDGFKVRFMQILYLSPFPTSEVREILARSRKTIVVENNKTSQLSSLIREHLLVNVSHKILKYDGRPFNPSELAESLKGVL